MLAYLVAVETEYWREDETQYRFGSAAVMNYFVLSIFFCYAYAASIDEAKNLLRNELKIFRKCMVDGNVTESTVENIYKKGEIPETRAVKCVLGCYMKGMGYLNDDGKLDWNKLDEINKIEYVDPAQAKKALEITAGCSKTVSQTLGNICDAGYFATKCFVDGAIKRELPIFGLDSAP